MRYKNRQFSAISLSFLDVMSCGFGAFILLFLIIKHQTNAALELPEDYLDIEISKLSEQIIDANLLLTSLTDSLILANSQIESLETQTGQTQRALAKDKLKAPKNKSSNDYIATLKAKLKRLELERNNLAQKAKKKPSDIRTFVGDGNREYLTGMQLGGKRILILLDRSASMLDKSIVNIIRKRNMSDKHKRSSKKWQQALATVDWITARFPYESSYQIYGFNEVTKPILSGTDGQWLKVADLDQVEAAAQSIKQIIPTGGSSIESAFVTLEKLKPPPDNIYLITDGLPTLGLKKPIKSTVSGKKRLKLFEAAVERLPINIPVNVILLPMEGDPLAPWAYWGIAAVTKGSFLSPASDWP